MTRGAFAALTVVFGLCVTSVRAWRSDNGNGAFANPLPYADWPDSDIIRVGDDFCFSTTTFPSIHHASPHLNGKKPAGAGTISGFPRDAGKVQRHGLPHQPQHELHLRLLVVIVT